MTNYLRSINCNKTEIKWNKNPIKMDLFLSFLTVEVSRSKEHLGSCNGWTLLNGSDNLIIGGGRFNNTEYLDTIQYKKNLHNQYNNYVNPFFLFDIMNDNGKAFFIDYYKNEIKEIMDKATSERQKLEDELEKSKLFEKNTHEFWNKIIS